MITPRKESRLFPRIKFANPLRCQVRGNASFDRTLAEDISLSGIGFISDRFIPPSTNIMLQINLFTHMVNPIARIVWSSPFAHANRFMVGAEFVEMDAQEKKSLEDYITLKLHQS